MALNINPSLDIKYLNQVYGEDAMIIHLIFDAFLSDSLPRWESLKLAIDNEDLVQSASILHGLKPSFTMAGITWFRPKIEEFEKAVKDKSDITVLKNLYSDLSDELYKLTPILETESERLGKH